MRRRQCLTHLDRLHERTDDFRRHLLTDSYRDLANEAAELLPLASGPNPPAPRLTQRLAVLETALGKVPPADVLNGWDVFRIAVSRSRLR